MEFIFPYIHKINIFNNFELTYDGKIIYKQRSTLYKMSSIIIILSIMFITYLFNSHGSWISGMFCILSVIIIYASYTGGTLISLSCVNIILLYYYVLFNFPISPFSPGTHIIKNVMTNIVNLYIISIASGLITNKFNLCMNNLLVNQQCISKAEDLSMITIIYTSLEGKLVRVHPYIYKIIGYTEQELKSINLVEMMHPEDLKRDASYYNNLIKGSISSFEKEERFIKKNGEIIWLYVSCSLIRNSKGKPFQILTYTRNITRRKSNEVALRESEERYRNLMELIPDSLIVHVNNKITFCNTAAAKYFGYKNRNDAIGDDIYKFIHFSSRDTIFKRTNDFLYKGVSVPLIEEKLLSIDNKILEAEVVAIPLPKNCDNACLVIFRDISARKEAERNQKLLNEAIEHDKLKTEFFSNLSHELRTPLNVLLASLQLLDLYISNNKVYDTEDRLNKYTKIMKQNCFRLLRLINNLIDITKIDAGYYKLHKKNVDIINIVENISISVADYMESRGLELIFDTDVEEKIMAFDPDKIERIMLNLLSNSIKFTDKGGKVMVTIHDKGDKIQIAVKDTGIGIPYDKQKIIFERFSQVDKSFTRNNEGSGIGLSLVKSLVELHNGIISLNSSCGIGSEFIIELPISIIEEKNQIIDNKMPPNKVEIINMEFSDIYL